MCAIIAGGSTLLPRLLHALLRDSARAIQSKSFDLNKKTYSLLVHFVSTFLSACWAFHLLNRPRTSTASTSIPASEITPSHDPAVVATEQSPAPQASQTSIKHSSPTTNQLLAGKSLDLTLFAFTRALDVVIGSLWRSWSLRRQRANRFTRVERLVGSMTDAGVFAASCSIIMWAWFYLPHRLPRSYNHWISEAAQIDSRLIEALRLARQGKFIYGKDTGVGELCSSLCTDLGLPEKWGDPAKTIPLPCQLVHLHSGPNCEYHALSRFFRAFRFALATYLPLQLALRLRTRTSQPMSSRFLSILRSSARSSAFLSLFITLFYYSVCLSRTRLGPKIFSSDTVTPQMWDSGLCVGAGCMTCGWSILVEKPERRQEIAFFVAPRALATVLPRRYERTKLWREGLAFAASTAIVMTAITERRGKVRGVLGKVLEGVLRE